MFVFATFCGLELDKIGFPSILHKRICMTFEYKTSCSMHVAFHATQLYRMSKFCNIVKIPWSPYWRDCFDWKRRKIFVILHKRFKNRAPPEYGNSKPLMISNMYSHSSPVQRRSHFFQHLIRSHSIVSIQTKCFRKKRWDGWIISFILCLPTRTICLPTDRHLKHMSWWGNWNLPRVP